MFMDFEITDKGIWSTRTSTLTALEAFCSEEKVAAAMEEQGGARHMLSFNLVFHFSSLVMMNTAVSLGKMIVSLLRL